MLKKCLSPTMLLKANAIMEQVSKDIETNMSQEEINALIKYQLSNNPAWTIQSVAAKVRIQLVHVTPVVIQNSLLWSRLKLLYRILLIWQIL